MATEMCLAVGMCDVPSSSPTEPITVVGYVLFGFS